ncbi:MAG: transglycosylase domain-containing protein, partial [Bdellovibrio sp.]
NLSKKEILERYLNLVEFGNGVFGIQAAARKYFNKSPVELSPVESAYLAHLLPNPKVYSRTHQRRALTAFSYSQVLRILSLMKVTRAISEEQYAQAKIELLVIWPGTLAAAEESIEAEPDLEPESESVESDLQETGSK